ncbi:MAG: gamma-glutamyl-gamma-aminobutyrate hydrolase family protein [Pseudomonadota bacterium]
MKSATRLILIAVRTALVVISVVLVGIIGMLWAYHVPDPAEESPVVIVSAGSTLWNRLGMNQITYIRRLRLAGLSPYVVLDRDINKERISDLWNDVGASALVLTGGGDIEPRRYGGDQSTGHGVVRRRDALEFALLEEAERRSAPVLGLCRGAQAINVFRGGTLGDIRNDAERYKSHRSIGADHPVDLQPQSKLADIFGSTNISNVTTWHGQHVASTGDGLVASAQSVDHLVEAVELSGERFVIGVQWHAEWPPWDLHQQRLFDAFANAVRSTN